MAEIVQKVKGTGSYLVNHAIDPGQGFKWQRCYGAFTFRKGEVARVYEYVMSQKARHARGDLWPEFERVSDDPPVEDGAPRHR